MRTGLFWLSLVTVGALAVLLAQTPTGDYSSADSALLDSYQRLLAANGESASPRAPHARTLSVMTYNIRFETEESDPDNNFSNRKPRLAATIHRWAPDVVGLQEPFAPQVALLLKELDRGTDEARYAAVGYERTGYNGTDGMEQSERTLDYQTAILYRSDRFELVDHQHVWLSKTPSVEGSKDWGSVGTRTATLAVLRRRDAGGVVILVNAHIDHACEKARRNQARLVREIAAKWQLRWPGAAVVVTGDFNSAPGQTSHRILTDPGRDEKGIDLHDAWVTCAGTLGCEQNNIAMTFHGWLGAGIMDTYAVRLLVPFIFTLHAMQFTLPRHMPSSTQEWVEAVQGLLMSSWEYPLSESVPSGGGRFHLDWVLHTPAATPLLTAVVDARKANFSSDHFAVLALLELEGDRVRSAGSDV